MDGNIVITENTFDRPKTTAERLQQKLEEKRAKQGKAPEDSQPTEEARDRAETGDDGEEAPPIRPRFRMFNVLKGALNLLIIHNAFTRV